MTELNPEWTKRARHVLVDEGADSEEGGWHSWRCFDKERYPEPCDCTAEAAERALSAVAPLIAAQALEDAADALDREEAEEAAKVRMGNVRCLVCELEWNQRSHFGCHGNYHEFDGADLSRAGEVRIEETYAGQFLRARAVVETKETP